MSVADLQQPLEVEMLSPPACCHTADQSVTEASISGRVLVEGVLHGRAMVNKRDTLAAAVDLLKVGADLCLTPLYCEEKSSFNADGTTQAASTYFLC